MKYWNLLIRDTQWSMICFVCKMKLIALIMCATKYWQDMLKSEIACDNHKLIRYAVNKDHRFIEFVIHVTLLCKTI